MDIFSLEKSQKIALNLIRINGEISAAELAKEMQMRPSSLVYIIRALRDKEIIEVSGTGKSTKKGGKKPTMWKIKSGKGFIMGLEVLSQKIRIVITDLNGTSVYAKEHIVQETITKEKISEQIKQYIIGTIQTTGYSLEQFIGTGIALPGLVDRRNGILYCSTELGISEGNIKSELQQIVPLDIEIINDANAGALGIKWFHDNTKTDISNSIYITYNHGAPTIGIGLVLYNQLYEGSSGTAGEIPENIRVHWKDKDFRQVFSEFLSKEVIRLIYLLNPELLVLGGELTSYKEMISEVIEPYIHKTILPQIEKGMKKPHICFSEFGQFSVATGATALIYEKIYSS